MIRRSRRLELYAWNMSPALLTFALALFCLLPKHISGLSNFMPILPLAPIFFWGANEAREMPFWFVFFIGILADGATGQTFGLSAVLNLFFLTTVHAQRKYIHKEGFVIKWGYFALLVAGYQLAAWGVNSLLLGHALPIGSAFFQWLLTICFYPFLHKGFEKLNDRIYHRRWQIIHGV